MRLNLLVMVVLVVGCGGTAATDAGPPDADLSCPDTDGDFIADVDEGSVDTDGDGIVDEADLDSDADGIDDAAEAGDADSCTAPRDTDQDGIADFRETDSDGNGIPDAAEPPGDIDGDGFDNGHDRDDDGDGMFDVDEWGPGPAPVDNDGDGEPDYRDLDSDDDDVGDRYEGPSDGDCDGIGAYLDLDADGDGIADSIEGPAGQDPPIDFDDDGQYDFLDIDADDDGLQDAAEDLNGNGVLDPGESSAHDPDTDDDSNPDLVEWAAGTDPQDPGFAEDDIFAVLPIFGETADYDLEFSTEIIRADVVFEIDNTSSMGGTITTLRDALQTVLVPQLALQVPNVAFGVVSFQDFPIAPFGGTADVPFALRRRVTTNVSAVQEGLDALIASGGGDIPESGIEAFYQTLTGSGITWPGAPASGVPKFEPMVGFNPSQGHGTIGGVGFRVGSLPIVLHITDATFHDAPEYIAAGIVDASSRLDAVAAAQAMGARFIGVTSHAPARAELESIALDTGAAIPPAAWGGGTCPGSSTPPPSGLCPLSAGMSIPEVVEAVAALVNHGLRDISALPVADAYELPEVDTSLFVSGIVPVPPAPPGASIDGEVFSDVLSGTPVTFRVSMRNTFIDHRREAQLFRVTIRVLGDEVALLDQRDVYAIIPGGNVTCD